MHRVESSVENSRLERPLIYRHLDMALKPKWLRARAGKNAIWIGAPA